MLKNKINYYFFSAIVLIIFFKILEFPSLTLHAQPFAETGTNFFAIAYEKSFLQNIIATDAGYIPLLERLIAVILVKGLHLTTYFVIAAQLIAVFFVALFSSIITLKVFRNIFPSDLLRFILALSIGLIPEYELLTFINFPYYGFVPVFLLLFIDKEKLKLQNLVLLFCFLILLILSKPHFLLFLPVFMFVSFFAYKMRLWKTALFYGGAIIALLLQIVSVLFHPLAFHVTNIHRPFFKKIAEIIYAITSMYKHAFFNDHLFYSIPGFLIFLILLSVVLIFFIKIQLKNINRFPLYFFFIANYFAIFSIILTIMTIAAIFPPSMPFFALPNDRHFLFTNIAVLFAGTMVLQTFVKKQWVLVTIVSLLLFTSNAFLYPFNKDQQKGIMFTSFDQYPIQQMSYAQWDDTAIALQNSDYCIPVNPFPWLLQKNCNYLNHFQEVQTTQKKIHKFDIDSKYPKSNMWRIRALILVNIPHHNTFQKITIFALDKNNTIVGKAQQLSSDSTANYLYFYFPKKVIGATKLVFFAYNRPITIIPEFIFLGTQ